MSTLIRKHIVLGISGGIAAYKAAELTRLLRKAGAEVRVVMTRGAQEFITPLTLQALSGNPVHTELFDLEAESAMGHIDLARWADMILIAPASANVMARLAQGSADDLLSTLCLASEAPILLAPAMNRMMWDNPATQENRRILEQRGFRLIGPASGEQACGEIGKGRMEEPEMLLSALEAHFHTGSLAGKKVVITAGPTREAIDPVRYISNRSSGKMGYALAQAAQEAGAIVTLISGPVQLEAPSGVQRNMVETAQQMLEACMSMMDGCALFIATAAVADYRIATPLAQKQKKNDETWNLELTRNPDILARIAALPDAPFTLGFAAETEQLEDHARAKLSRKGLDMIAANLVGEGLAFDQDDNALEVFWANGHRSLPRQPKERLARALIDLAAERLNHNNKIIEIHHAKS
jgi:phosphopantothenoylcysteine decarboxylase / phosphopantothenate---cysteine ligase